MTEPFDVQAFIARALGRPARAWRPFAGGQQDVYAVSVDADDDFILKRARPGNAARLRHEQRVLPLLPAGLGPDVVATGDAFILMRSAGPENLARRFKRGDDCAESFREMGRRLRAIHDLSLADAPAGTIAALETARADVAQVVRRDAVGRYARAGGPADGWPTFAALIEQTIAAPTRRLLHGDYNTRQVICDGPRVTAIVDLEYACLGGPALDLLRMELTGIRGRADFYAGYDRRDVASRHRRLFATLDAMHAATS